MKKVILSIATMALSTMLVAQTEYKADAENCIVNWKGEKVTGYHEGTLKLKEGSITMKDGQPVNVSAVADMTTIICTDLEDPGYNQKLVGHLKSEDFFSVEKFPTVTFNGKKFEPIKGAKGKEPNYKVTGDLTIKGKTQPITFEAYISESNGVLSSMGDIVFDRTKYDIRYGSGSFFDGLGDKMIYDDVKLSYSLKTKK